MAEGCSVLQTECPVCNKCISGTPEQLNRHAELCLMGLSNLADDERPTIFRAEKASNGSDDDLPDIDFIFRPRPTQSFPKEHSTLAKTSHINTSHDNCSHSTKDNRQLVDRDINDNRPTKISSQSKFHFVDSDSSLDDEPQLKDSRTTAATSSSSGKHFTKLKASHSLPEMPSSDYVCLSDDELGFKMPVAGNSATRAYHHSISSSDDDDKDYMDSLGRRKASEEMLSGSLSKAYSSRTVTSAIDSQCSSVASSVSTASKKSGSGRSTASDDPTKAALKVTKQAEKERKLQEKEEKRLQREEEKQRREKAKQEVEFEKTRKRLIQDSLRSKKPGECMKHITVRLDSQLLSESFGPAIVTCLQTNGVKFEVEKQAQPNMIGFWREQVLVTETEDKKLKTTRTDIAESEVLMYVPLQQFLQLVDNFHKDQNGVLVRTLGTCTLTEFIRGRKSALENRKLTLFVKGLESYYRKQKNDTNKQFHERVRQLSASDGNLSAVPKRKKKAMDDSSIASVGKMEVEEALLIVMFEIGTIVKFLETDVEVAKLVFQYTKAIAERPYKLEKRANEAAAFSMYVGGNRGIKILPDGTGITDVWRQQLMQFKNISADIASAIIAQYPSPRALFEAYRKCTTTQEAELLLEDIVVRRGTGVLATTRRVGKEHSRRLHTFLMSTEPDEIIT